MTLQEIQKSLKVPKSNNNSFGKYKYRSCEDILEAVKPLMEDCSLTLSDEVVSIGNHNYVKATAKFIGDGGLTEVTAYAREPETQAGMSASQLTGTASSYARKYALNGLFLIDDTKDADTDEFASKASQNANLSDIEPSTAQVEEVQDMEERFNKNLDNDRV